MKQCICCKFDNCKAEFQKHKSNTTFSALEAQFERVAECIEHPQDFAHTVCLQHCINVGTWLEDVFEFYDSLKGGVSLPKIHVR